MWENITIKGRQPTPINWRVILNLFILPLNAPLHYVFCFDLNRLIFKHSSCFEFYCVITNLCNFVYLVKFSSYPDNTSQLC